MWELNLPKKMTRELLHTKPEGFRRHFRGAPIIRKLTT